MIQFTCDGCGANLEIADKWAARPVRCLYCGIVHLVPGRFNALPPSNPLPILAHTPAALGVLAGFSFPRSVWRC